MKGIYIGILIAVLAILGLMWYVSTDNAPEMDETAQNDDTPAQSVDNDTLPDTSRPTTDDSDVADTTRPADGVTPPAVIAGAYDVYTPEKAGQADEGPVVLFFKATWCPSCQALDADIKENLEDIPENVTILEVDYDEYTDLRKQYGVTTQHTLVQIDENGDAIQKWSGGSTLDTVLAKL